MSVICLLTGIVLILVIGLPFFLSLFAVAAWALYVRIACRRIDLRRLRVYANGDVHLQRVDGQWLDGRVGAGSLFLPQIAWLRVEGRTPYQGWFIPRDDADGEWRRLRVIARHFADI